MINQQSVPAVITFHSVVQQSHERERIMQTVNFFNQDGQPVIGSFATSTGDEEELLQWFSDLNAKDQARSLEYVRSLATK